MSFSLIAAVGQNNELGKKGGLVFHIPEDLKYFKKVTLGHPVFMGLNTWRSLPGKLPGRKDTTEEIFVIGGGMVYKQMLPHCNKLYLTEVHASDSDADVFFPEFDKTTYKKTVISHGTHDKISYDFVEYAKNS